jgi:integrase
MPSAIKRHLTDATVKAIEPPAAGFHYYRDTEQPGLLLRVAAKGKVWRFEGETRVDGKRRAVSKQLGSFPKVKAAAARRAVISILGKIADEAVALGPRQGGSFQSAFDAYVKHLRSEVERKHPGKPARNADQVQWMGDKFLKAKWGDKTLIWLAQNQRAIEDWHKSMAETPVQANKLARTVRAVYRHACRYNHALRRDLHPSETVKWFPEKPREAAMPYADFPAWKTKLDAIENPTRRAFHAVNILTGCRPGELARLVMPDVHLAQHQFILRGVKNGRDHIITTTPEIERWLKLALDATLVTGPPMQRVLAKFGGAGHVFPSVRGGHLVRFDTDGLSHCGQALRGSYRTVATDLQIPELIIMYMMAHSARGISQKYISQAVLAAGDAVREAQQRISDRVVDLWAGVNVPQVTDPYAGYTAQP